jgi:hypothetical protein
VRNTHSCATCLPLSLVTDKVSLECGLCRHDTIMESIILLMGAHPKYGRHAGPRPKTIDNILQPPEAHCQVHISCSIEDIDGYPVRSRYPPRRFKASSSSCQLITPFANKLIDRWVTTTRSHYLWSIRMLTKNQHTGSILNTLIPCGIHSKLSYSEIFIPICLIWTHKASQSISRIPYARSVCPPL